MRYRSHNNLIRYFIEDHSQLPDAYLRSCKKFFNKIKQTPEAPYKNFFWPTVPQRQAASSKQQAPSVKHQARQTGQLHKPGIRVKNRFNRKV